MIKPHAQWSYTDQPDVFRMCRELREADCRVGAVERKDGTITLVDMRDPGFRDDVRAWAVVNSADRFHVFAGWFCLRGDQVRSILGVSPVTVRGYR